MELIRELRKRVPVVLITNATVWFDDDLAGVPTERCLFIDDSQINVDSARTVGMTAVHYRCFENLYEAVTPLLTRLAQ
ncbi:hypothetical protein [Nocardia salmonicida]|uniref:hypothetical protein n=1 Tax=Nocardia salmonicida TaxID=53431 RepID=UPI0033BFDB64